MIFELLVDLDVEIFQFRLGSASTLFWAVYIYYTVGSK